MDDPPTASQVDAEPAGGGVHNDPTWLTRILLYGQPETRRRAAARLAADVDSWQLLAATVRSDEPWQLRARSLEALGLVAGAGGQETAEQVLRLLVERTRNDARTEIGGTTATTSLDGPGIATLR